jgi:hypothetical protein
VPNIPALRDPKQDVATQRENMIAPAEPKRRDPKSCNVSTAGGTL